MNVLFHYPNAEEGCQSFGTKLNDCLLAENLAYLGAFFGRGSGPIYIGNVTCNGSESQLIDCVYDNDTTQDTHAEDAGVRCQQC